GFTLLGEAVSAESRQCFRVCAALTSLKATVGKAPSCQVMDVSASGFSFVTDACFSVGESVAVSFCHDGRKFAGTGTVQSISALEPGRVRYGVFCGGRRNGDLERGLNLVCASLQRAQMKRLAGA